MKFLKSTPNPFETKVKLWGPPLNSHGPHSGISVEKLEDVLCQECRCAASWPRIISEPLFHLPEEQEDSDLWNFENKYTWLNETPYVLSPKTKTKATTRKKKTSFKSSTATKF